jgi:hypothetical protein
MRGSGHGGRVARCLLRNVVLAEERALDFAPHNLHCWFRYVDDTFVIWPHGPDKLKDFLNHHCIQFTMETEIDGHLPFLDIDIYRRPNGSLGHTVCRKSTHTNL